jgi:hypothetical protein
LRIPERTKRRCDDRASDQRLENGRHQIERDLVELIRPEYRGVEDEGRTFIQTVLPDKLTNFE